MRDEYHVNTFINQKQVSIQLDDGQTIIIGELLALTDHRAVVDIHQVKNLRDDTAGNARGKTIIMTHQIAAIMMMPKDQPVSEAPETPQEVVQQAISEIEGTGG